MPFSYPATPRYKIPAGPWFLAEASTTIPVKDADGKTVASVKYGAQDLAVATFIGKIPELLETAMWAEAALGYLAARAPVVEDRPEFERRYRAVNQLLNELRS